MSDRVPAELVIVLAPADVPPVDGMPTDSPPTDSSTTPADGSTSPTDTSASDGTNLPSTGIGTAAGLLAGLMLLAGVAMVLVGRRRRSL